jgi:hypothetical protein
MNEDVSFGGISEEMYNIWKEDLNMAKKKKVKKKKKKKAKKKNKKKKR